MSVSTAPGETPTSGSGATQPGVAGLIVILLVAACLRPAITSVGPILLQIGRDLTLDEAALGLLGTLPLLCFAVASWFVPRLVNRTGSAGAVLLALVGLAASIGLRSVPGVVALWVGTVGVGTCIAIGNVVVPALVKESFPARVSVMSGIYSAVIGLSSALASGIAEPLSRLLGGWRSGLAVWALPTLLVAGAWWRWALRHAKQPATAGMSRDSTRGAAIGPTTPLWRSVIAWQVTAFMGLQSFIFYLLVTWLPAMASQQGVSATLAGWLLFGFQAAGVLAGPAFAAAAGRRDDQRWLCAVASGAMTVAAFGQLLLPSLALVWILLAGIAQGATFALALALIPLRSSSAESTVRLSGMAQSIGYGFAALGPAVAGWLVKASGTWTSVLVLLGVAAVAQTVAAYGAGRAGNAFEDAEQ